MPDIHLPYGGSTMARDVHCHANRRLSKDIPDTGAGPAAAHGSCLHECMEALIDPKHLNVTPGQFVGQYFDEWDHTVDADDAALLQTALDAFVALCEEYFITDWEIEAFVQLTPDLVGGSADVIAWGDDDVLIIDWKFGYTPVSAEKSWQGATYALSAAEEKFYAKKFKGKNIHCVIIQPKVSKDPSVYLYSPAELDDMFDTILDTVEIHEAGGGEPTAGAHCLFCKAGPVCPAKIVEARAALIVPAEVSMDLATAMALATQLEPWVKQVKEFAHTMLESGAEVEGWKLVDKRATRQWEDKGLVMDKLKPMRRLKLEDYSDIKLKSAPQLEKVCKAKKINFEKEFGHYVVKRSSGTTLAPADDERPDVTLITQGDITAALKKIA